VRENRSPPGRMPLFSEEQLLTGARLELLVTGIAS
jgi:hypothetical protein